MNRPIELRIEELVLEDARSDGHRTAHEIGTALARLLELRGIPTTVASKRSVVLEASPVGAGARSRSSAEGVAGSIYRALEESGL